MAKKSKIKDYIFNINYLFFNKSGQFFNSKRERGNLEKKSFVYSSKITVKFLITSTINKDTN